MCQATRGVDAVDAADVARSCGDKAANCCVSEARAAVVVTAVFGVPVTVLVVNRSPAVQCSVSECAVQLRGHHPQGSVGASSVDLDAGLNQLLDSGSSHWMAVEYPEPAWLHMPGVGSSRPRMGWALAAAAAALSYHCFMSLCICRIDVHSPWMSDKRCTPHGQMHLLDFNTSIC
jgi:hypothetical protein